MLFQLRRRMKGWRLTEELADEFCEQLRLLYEGAGFNEGRLLLRRTVREQLATFLREHGKDPEIDDEFERDWAAALFTETLHAFKRTEPELHLLFLRVFDRPEGLAPVGAAELAARLGQPADIVASRLSQGRLALRKLFADEIAQTVADPGAVDDEVAELMPRAHRLFRDGAQSTR